MLHEIDLSRTDLNLLVLFEAVMHEGHVGRAARRLDLSPSAISHGLGRLREMLGDPVCLRTPRGMVPTDRARTIAPRVAEILAAVRGVIATAEPFDPARSDRRFRIATGDAVLGVFGARLLAHLAETAPGIGLSVIHVVPRFSGRPDAGLWDDVLAMLDGGALDVAILPTLGLSDAEADFPARFAARPLGQDALVAVAHAGHPFLAAPTLDAYCAARHMIVSLRGDATGAIDAHLADLGRSRRVVLTVPNFMVALFVAAGSDLVAALPSSLVAAHGAPLGLGCAPLPLADSPSTIVAVTTHAALRDAGVAWLAETLADVAPQPAAASSAFVAEQ